VAHENIKKNSLARSTKTAHEM